MPKVLPQGAAVKFGERLAVFVRLNLTEQISYLVDCEQDGLFYLHGNAFQNGFD